MKMPSAEHFSSSFSYLAAFTPKDRPRGSCNSPLLWEGCVASSTRLSVKPFLDKQKGHHLSGFQFQCASDWPINIIFNSFSSATLTV